MLASKKLAITEDIFAWEQYCFDREESDITEIVIHTTGGGGTRLEDEKTNMSKELLYSIF